MPSFSNKFIQHLREQQIDAALETRTLLPHHVECLEERQRILLDQILYLKTELKTSREELKRIKRKLS